MTPDQLRIALFSGNYNYIRDGANQALNRLVGDLIGQGAAVRVYSPVTDTPAFPPTGDLVGVPSFAVPGRPEYRVAYQLNAATRADLAAFAPNLVHISSPDLVAHRAVSWARRRGVPVVASIHTRFETYLQYYHLQLLEPAVRAMLRRLYRRCDAVVAPAESTAAILRAQRMSRDISIWSRGIDRIQFNPGRRSLEWRRARGIADDQAVVIFLGRVVMEKGLDVFTDAVAAARASGAAMRVMVIGEGPAMPWFREHLPDDAVFTGLITGEELATALASGDMFLNPSITEAFGNVTLEAMASALPVIAAHATGTTNLVRDGITGTLVDPQEPEQFGEAIVRYVADPTLRQAHGAAGLAFALTQDWDEINAAVVTTYLRVIGRRERILARFGARTLPK